jgi:hypothetical protein
VVFLSVAKSMVNWGDAPAWVAAVVAVLALIISCCSAVLSWKSLYWERLSAESASRSAEAAERANRRTEQTVLAQQLHPFGIPFEEAVGVPSVERAPDVSWSIEHPDKNRYVLRNTGTEVAEHVEVDPSQAGIARNRPKDAVIRPGEGADMLIMGSWQRPVPNQLYVRWAGQPDWVALPLP